MRDDIRANGLAVQGLRKKNGAEGAPYFVLFLKFESVVKWQFHCLLFNKNSCLKWLQKPGERRSETRGEQRVKSTARLHFGRDPLLKQAEIIRGGVGGIEEGERRAFGFTCRPPPCCEALHRLGYRSAFPGSATFTTHYICLDIPEARGPGSASTHVHMCVSWIRSNFYNVSNTCICAGLAGVYLGDKSNHFDESERTNHRRCLMCKRFAV